MCFSASLAVGVLAPSMPPFTLSDETVVPAESGVLSLAADLSPPGPAPYGGQGSFPAPRPLGGPAESVPAPYGGQGSFAAPCHPAGPAESAPAPYGGQGSFAVHRPPVGPAGSAPPLGHRPPLPVPAAHPRPCPVRKIRRPPNAFMVFANEHR